MSEVKQGELQYQSGWKVGVVTSRFNAIVTERLETGAMARLRQLAGEKANIEVVRVPGALEIPVAARWLLDQGCDGVVALGVVIRGETSHYDYVCAGAERGCTQLQIETGKPIAFGVLTTENKDQALARAGGEKGHKGEEAAEVLVEMLNLKTLVKQ